MVMTILDARKDQYNKFSMFPLAPYNVIKYLMANEEELWKILKYQDPDAWNKPDLTLEDKANLVYAGQPNETDYRVFMDSGNDNAWTVEACILRVTNLNLIPNNYVYGSLSIGFQVYSHYKINTMSNYTVRTDYVTQRLIEALNGSDIDGIGRLYFDFKASTLTKSVIIGAIPFKGRATVMCNYALG
jgi:hypothetical protein